MYMPRTILKRLACLLLAGWSVFGPARALAEEPPPYEEDTLGNYFSFMSLGEWMEVADGVEFRLLELSRDTSPLRVQVALIRLDLRQMRLEVLEARRYGKKALTVAEFAEKAEGFGLVNASFFDPENRPLGYLWDGKNEVVADIRKGGPFTGGLQIADGKAAILPRRRLKQRAGEIAIQAGPRLLVDGAPPKGLANPLEPERRTGVALQDERTVILYATHLTMGLELLNIPAPKGDGLTFREIALLFGKTGQENGFHCPNVLNLDGGTSSGLALRAEGTSFTIPSYVPVPVALGFKRRMDTPAKSP